MMKTILALITGTLLGACVFPTYVDTRPLMLSDDLTRHPVTSATCTRGNTPFKMTVQSDGSAVGELILPKQPGGAPSVEPSLFPLSLNVRDPKTVMLTVEAGKATSEAVTEALSPIVTGGNVILRGDSFDCSDVQVRLEAV